MLTKSQSISKHFLETFGYLELKLPDKFIYDDFILDVNSKSVSKFSKEWNDIVYDRRSYCLFPYADVSVAASNFLVNTLDPCVQDLLGKNYFYIGSDASIFFQHGSAWHRDTAMLLPILKLLVYLDYDSRGHCCDFHIIPGSHHVTSSYSALLQKGLAWPGNSADDGGLSENEIFPSGSDHTASTYDYEKDVIPNKKITISKGSAIIFNQAAIHAVKSKIIAGRPRRLITFAFCANPNDLAGDIFKISSKGKLQSHDVLVNELYMFLAIQGKRLGYLDYGKELQKFPEYIRNHGVDWSRIREISEKSCQDYVPEDGGHDVAQMKKMNSFLTRNFMSIP